MSTPTRTPNQATSTRPERSSRRVAHKKPLAWLPLALLAALALLIGLIALGFHAADDDKPSGSTVGQAGGSTGSGTDSSSGSAGAAGSGQGTTGAAGTGAAAQLRAADKDLLALSGSSLTSHLGDPVSGSARVQSVVADEGFWVGSSPAQRVFVYLSPKARRANGESPFQVKAGQTVKLTGQLTDPQRLPKAVTGVTDAEGLSQLRQQGALVDASSVELAG